MTILVIDDDRNLLENLLTLLRFEGYEPLGASNGTEGIALARQHLPDLIVCDIMMPEVSGYAVLNALRESPETQSIPLVFLTSKAARHDQRQGMSMGANDYITKPFTYDIFLRAIKARLSRHGAVQQAFQQQIDSLRQAVVFALPPELRMPLGDILDRTEYLLADPAALTADDVSTSGATLLNAARQLHRQIENYLIFAQLEILQIDSSRVIVQREAYVEDPAAVIRTAAEQAGMQSQRADDMQIMLNTVPLHITTDSLRKVAEELIGYALATSPAGAAVTVTGQVADDTYALQITAQDAAPAPALADALAAPVRLEDRLRQRYAPLLGVIVTHHLLRAHDGYLSWHEYPDGMQWTAQFALWQGEPTAP